MNFFDYLLHPRTPADDVAIVRQQARDEHDMRLIRAARQRIADGTCSDAVKAMLADWSSWEVELAGA